MLTLFTLKIRINIKMHKNNQVTYQELIDLKVEAMDLSALEVLNKTNITSFVIGMDEVLNFEP